MITTVTPGEHTSTVLLITETSAVEQLTLLTVPGAADLAPSTAHARFHLSQTTRERGLAHVAEIRRQLAATHGETGSKHTNPLPTRSHAA